MRKTYFIFILFISLISCKKNLGQLSKTGSYTGLFKSGNFSDNIKFEIEKDSTNWNVFFTSLEQNANRIPFQNVEEKGDSINFKLQSDFYAYIFKNKWVDDYTKLKGSLTVDMVTVQYILEKESYLQQNEKSEDVSFTSNGLNLNGTIWHPKNDNNKALVILTSSGNVDRSASRAEAILFSQMGYTTFHYDKRGTGNSEGGWATATMQELISDDINAIQFFSTKTGIPISSIGIKGSSQGATKVPYVLNELSALKYGIVVSCPGTTLLESDLNYWKNRNSELLGENMNDAEVLQRNVFRHIAGQLTRADLENEIAKKENKTWFKNIWIPNLDEVQIDRKLNYSPIPYFEQTIQPILVIHGTLDEIIPMNSYRAISKALTKANNFNHEIIKLNGASHSMYYVGESDFPYWSKLHPNYMNTIENWLNNVHKEN